MEENSVPAAAPALAARAHIPGAQGITASCFSVCGTATRVRTYCHASASLTVSIWLPPQLPGQGGNLSHPLARQGRQNYCINGSASDELRRECQPQMMGCQDLPKLDQRDDHGCGCDAGLNQRAQISRHGEGDQLSQHGKLDPVKDSVRYNEGSSDARDAVTQAQD